MSAEDKLLHSRLSPRDDTNRHSRSGPASPVQAHVVSVSSGHRPRVSPSYRRFMWLGICASWLFAAHSSAAVVQESIFFIPGFNKRVALLAFSQLFVSLVIIFLQQVLQVERSISAPLKFTIRARLPSFSCPVGWYALCGLLFFGSSYLTHYCNSNLGYAITVLFKSAKPLAVLIASVLFLERRTNIFDIIGVCLIVASVAGFSVLSKVGSYGASLLGLIGVTVALSLDASLYVVEEGFVLGRYRAPHGELLFFLNVFAFFFSGVGFLLSPTVLADLQWAVAEPGFMGRVVLWSCLNIAGTMAILRLITDFSSVHATLATSLRKVFTVTMSYMLFPKQDHLTPYHAIFLVGIFCGFVVQENSRRIHTYVSAFFSRAPSTETVHVP
eukprot:TRINITY_DN9255_c0_g1_i1.p1 TRINITY_DN9255_c0_g1~~TRINITY_DN9255_c0_g1_i1.p1  ORF type:complete len:385 (+),score=42.45 TRINITY_DN9255_c0_g1_i1:205-1359(+)